MSALLFLHFLLKLSLDSKIVLFLYTNKHTQSLCFSLIVLLSYQCFVALWEWGEIGPMIAQSHSFGKAIKRQN